MLLQSFSTGTRSAEDSGPRCFSPLLLSLVIQAFGSERQSLHNDHSRCPPSHVSTMRHLVISPGTMPKCPTMSYRPSEEPESRIERSSGHPSSSPYLNCQLSYSRRRVPSKEANSEYVTIRLPRVPHFPRVPRLPHFPRLRACLPAGRGTGRGDDKQHTRILSGGNAGNWRPALAAISTRHILQRKLDRTPRPPAREA